MRKMISAALAGMVAGAPLVGCGAPSGDIADISVVTVLPKEVGPGGYQTTLEDDGTATGYFYQATISDCGSVVVDTARAWASRHGWTEVEGRAGERTALLRLRPQGDTATAFVIRYSLASDRSLARVRITRERTGEPAPLPDDPSELAVPELVRGELVAAQCEEDG